MQDLATIANSITKETGIYTGGAIQFFESVGRHVFITALQHGLLPHHKLCDFGCGSLRLGYWFVRFLDADCYCGVEPVRKGVEVGKKYALGDALVASKRPRFDFNKSCDVSAFGEKFDFMVARSIFTHMGPGLVRKSLVSFRDHSAPGAVFLATYWQSAGRLPFRHDGHIGDDLGPDDETWARVVKYKFETLAGIAKECGLNVQEFDKQLVGRQVWLKFTKPGHTPQK